MPTPDSHTTKSKVLEDANRSLDPQPMMPSTIDRLDEIRRLLERMLLLAQTSADPSVEDSERVKLQEELDRLRTEIDAIAAGIEIF